MSLEDKERELSARFPDSEPCECQECREMCQRPPWPTPSEALALIEAGYVSRLMLDEWSPNSEDKVLPEGALILAPACPGYEGKRAPAYPRQSCTFLTEGGKCELHELGLKPFEARIARHDVEHEENPHHAVALLWREPQAKGLVEEWCKEHGVEPLYAMEAGEVGDRLEYGLDLLFGVLGMTRGER